MSDRGVSTLPETPDNQQERPSDRPILRSLGLGLITGAADDDCSAIGTYAAAGAKLGLSFLWTAPVTFPMMFAVVYLSGKLGQVTGQGLFAVVRERYPGWVLYPALLGVLIGNVFEAGADIGGMAAALNVLVPIPFVWLVIGMTVAILVLQIFGSYTLIRNVFRWLALSLLAYVGAAFLARPELFDTLKGTLIPTIQLNKDFLSLVVAVIGTTLSAYLYTWQSNEEVEEKIARGRTSVSQRRGTSDRALRHTRRDIVLGMFFSNLIMYFIILATAATLHKAGKTDIATAAEAAQALRPLAGDAAGILFALGVVAVGFLAVPVMTGGAAYDVSQALGWKSTLSARPNEAKGFYTAILVFTALALGVNLIGLNPMKVLVWSGIVQGFSTPPLMLLILLLTNDRKVMGHRVNSIGINLLGIVTLLAIFGATLGLVVSLLLW
ncbi:MAG: Nramp family divalent metal transporter [Verrucomicrobia bacterium]|nr:Nramp family divalent metal transporter [Verrucomicrobiota bacterium]